MFLRTRSGPDQRRANGGVPARRAVARWSMRLFRREWRQQLLVLALLTVAVAGVIFGASAAYNVTSTRASDFGTADLRITLDATNAAARRAGIAAVARRFGTIDVIGVSSVPVPGSVDTVEIRAQDPHGAYGAPMLALRAGRYPRNAGEIAITGGVADTFRTGVRRVLELGRVRRTVVGIVENPGKLSDEFALLPADARSGSDTITILVRGTPGAQCQICRGFSGGVELRGSAERTTAAVVVFAMATVALLLVCLVAAAGFLVVAQRRLRQLGMLGAIGATDRHLRLVLLVNGAVVGAVAAVVGAALGLVGWIAVAPALESAANHRIDRFDVPWWLVATGMALAVITATAAAWWPARTSARVPITEALSARPPRSMPARRPAYAALLCAAIGFVSLAAGIDTAHDNANLLLILVGLVAIVLAVLLVSPLAIRTIATAGARLPVAARLALRDLARFQARSAAALAAIGVGLGIAVAIVIVASAAVKPGSEGNLSGSQLLVRVGDGRELLPARTPSEIARMQAAVDRLAATLDHPSVDALDVALESDVVAQADGHNGRPVAELVRRLNEHSFNGVGPLFVGTPAVLDRFGIPIRSVDAKTDVLSPERGALGVFLQAGKTFIGNVADPRSGTPGDLRVQTIHASKYSSAPRSFIMPAAVGRFGLGTARYGWLVASAKPFTSAQLADARASAARAGLTVEARDKQHGLATTRSAATLGGMLLALGVLAMTVGLIRSEAGRDLRTLTATGATSMTRRTLTAVTAGALALLGVVLGLVAAYTALLASYLDDLAPLGRVPVAQLVATAVVIPLAATIAGFLLAGREPPAVARTAFE
jgi:putative ABC transport system permease protein